MKNKDKDNIEKFFEERLSGKHFVFRESDWERMEEKLDASPHLNKNLSSGGSRGKWILITTALILAFLLGRYGNKLSGILEAESYSNTAKSSVPANSDIKTIYEPEDEIQPIPKAEDMENNKAQNYKAGDVKKGIGTTKPADEANHIISAGTTEKRHLAVNDGSPISITEGGLFTSPGFVERKNKMIIPIEEPESFNGIIWSLNEDSLKLSDTDQKQYKLAIGLTYAPDLTSTGFFERRQMAQAIGLQLYCKLNKRWILQTGINYVKKAYEAQPENYKPYENYWDRKTNGYVPDEITGNCGVIDIPVNITYNWSGTGRLSFLTTAGVSNYFILNEEYYYKFNYYPNASYGWNTKENSPFIGGILNVSFGLSMKIKERTSLQLEPYLKVPLQDIGYGNLKLFSTGSFFTLKYDIF